MTNIPIDQNNALGFEYLTAGTQPSEVGVAPGQKNTLRIFDLHDANGKVRRDVGGWEITINDFSQQGYNHPEGLFSLNSNGFAWSELVTHRPNELVPPPATQAAQGFAISGDIVGIHSCMCFGTKFIGLGAAATLAIFHETSQSDLNLSASNNYSPGSSICSLSRVLDDGVERLAVGRIGAATQLLSDVGGTVNLTMHSSTNSTWGIILSGVNATTPGVPVMLMYCGATIGTKATNADLTTAITVTQTVNAGGFAIGAVRPKSGAQRAYWGIPRATTTAGALKFGAEVAMDIWSTNMEGTDLLPLNLDYLECGISQAVPYRDGILAVAFDGQTVVYWDGEKTFNLNIFLRRTQIGQTSSTIDSDQQCRVRTLIVNGPECGVLWQFFDQNATVAGRAYCELYNFESGTWHNFSPPITLTATGATADLPLWGQGGAVPSSLTHYVHVYLVTGDLFYTSFIPPAGQSLLWQWSLGAGGTSIVGIPTYDTSAALLGCRWWLDGIKRNPKVITYVEFDGNLDHGGSTDPWSFQVKVFGEGTDGNVKTAYDKTFAQGRVSNDYIRKNTGGWVNIFDVQPYFLVSASGTKRQIPQLLPITIRGLYSKTGAPLIEAQHGGYV